MRLYPHSQPCVPPSCPPPYVVLNETLITQRDVCLPFPVSFTGLYAMRVSSHSLITFTSTHTVILEVAYSRLSRKKIFNSDN